MSDSGPRVSTLELFFDLVFVLTITRLTHLVAHAHAAPDLFRAFLVLAVTWWMYGAYAWLTNNVESQLAAGRVGTRLLLLGGMAGFLVMAISIPGAAGQDGVLFALAYLTVVLVHAALFTRAADTSRRALLRVSSFNVAVALALLAAGVAPATWKLAIWLIAVLAILVTTVLRLEQGFLVDAGHFAERHGLIILIALGESVTDIGAGVQDVRIRPALVAAAVLGLSLAAAVWWSYFDGDDARAELALERAEPRRRARLAILAYWHAHLVMIAGIIVAAAGMQGVLGDVASSGAGPTTSTAAWLLTGGVAVYLAGAAAFRWLLRIGTGMVRGIGAVLILAITSVGLATDGLSCLALLVTVLIGIQIAERRLAVRPSASATSAPA
jgi:low temperature requirement protein LtrA